MNAMICRNCGAGLEADRIDTSLGVVTCSHCGSLHGIPGDDVDRSANSSAGEPAAKPENLNVTLPSRYKVRRGSGNLEITWPVGGLFHGLVLSIIAGGVAYMAITSGMLFLLIASACIVYFAAVRAINTHRIRIDGARLEVTQKPLPWPGTLKIDASDIAQLYATEHESRVETGDGANRNTQVRTHYRLSANTHSNGRIKVLSGLSDPHQALWLEQEIERLLGIVDKPVAGEHVS